MGEVNTCLEASLGFKIVGLLPAREHILDNPGNVKRAEGGERTLPNAGNAFPARSHIFGYNRCSYQCQRITALIHVRHGISCFAMLTVIQAGQFLIIVDAQADGFFYHHRQNDGEGSGVSDSNQHSEELSDELA